MKLYAIALFSIILNLSLGALLNLMNPDVAGIFMPDAYEYVSAKLGNYVTSSQAVETIKSAFENFGASMDALQAGQGLNIDIVWNMMNVVTAPIVGLWMLFSSCITFIPSLITGLLGATFIADIVNSIIIVVTIIMLFQLFTGKNFTFAE